MVLLLLKIGSESSRPINIRATLGVRPRSKTPRGHSLQSRRARNRPATGTVGAFAEPNRILIALITADARGPVSLVVVLADFASVVCIAVARLGHTAGDTASCTATTHSAALIQRSVGFKVCRRVRWEYMAGGCLLACAGCGDAPYAS